MLLLPIQGYFFEKRDSKKNLVLVSRSKSGKIIFILLDEIIGIYIRLTFINIIDFWLESLLWNYFRFFSIYLISSNCSRSDF